MQIIKRLNAEAIAMTLIGLFIGAMLGKVIIDRTASASIMLSEPRPYHGRIDDKTTRARLAPFQIITPEGSSAFLVKLVDMETGETAMSIFLEAGKTFETEAPIGSFKLKWASGENWKGESRLFGLLTDYQEAIEPLEFREEQGGYAGNTVELRPRVNGNLHSERIAPSKF
jgi:hypothetical protein